MRGHREVTLQELALAVPVIWLDVKLTGLGREPGRKPEVSNGGGSVGLDQDVARLDVPMRDRRLALVEYSRFKRRLNKVWNV